MSSLRRKLFSAFILLFLVCFIFAPHLTQASFSQSYIRLDRTHTSTATTGLVCAQPFSSGTEASVQVIFPTGFSVSSSTANWAVSTADIPSGSTPWPGIGTATAVSGQTVTFPSSDLSIGTLYCFQWTNSTALTTSSSTGSTHTATLRTRTGASATIDSSSLALNVVSNDQLAVTATVAAGPNDFQADLTSPTTGSPFPQNTTIDFTLTYGSYLLTSSNITVEAEWTLGTPEGSSTADVEVLDYVVGSASNGYNGTAPVVDIVNRKISWTIPNFPANTVNQTVTFQLKTNDSYKGSSQINFSVMGRVIGPGTQTPDSTLDRAYKYANAAPTATPEPGPSATPGPGPTATPTPIPAEETVTIDKIDIRSLTSSSAKIFVATTPETRLDLRYGTSPKLLTKSVKSLNYKREEELLLEDLLPNTQYYFVVTATAKSGKSARSDIFTFTTPSLTELPRINPLSLVVISNNVILFNPQQEEHPLVVISKNLSYSFRFALENRSVSVKNIRVFVRNKSVLGASTVSSDNLPDESNTVVEISPGLYSVLMKAPSAAGEYDVFARIYDNVGNIVESKIFDLKVSELFSVKDRATNAPLEAAQVTLYYYNTKDHIYYELSPEVFPIKNPSYTDRAGTISYALPQGTYKADVLSLGYKEKELVFTLGPGADENFPEVRLEHEGWNLATGIKYFGKVFQVAAAEMKDALTTFANSFRFFDATALVSVIVLIFLTALAMSSRLKIPLASLLHHFYHRASIRFLDKNERTMLSGQVKDSSGASLSGVEIFLIDAGNGKTLARTVTGAKGTFKLSLPESSARLLVVKEGYRPLEKELGLSDKELVLTLVHGKGALIAGIISYLKEGIGVGFEALLVFSFILEIALGFTLGWALATPFILVSFLNLLLWIFHVRSREIA